MKKPSVSLLSIGNEVVDGRIVNTNAAWLAQELSTIGLKTVRVAECRDELTEISEALSYLLSHSEIIITSGGLGPTTDDLTRHAIAEYVKKPLLLNEYELATLQARFRKRGRKFDNSNSIQAHFPEDSIIIKNPTGTAPGFITLLGSNQFLYSLPGVPRELKEMIQESVLEDIKSRFSSELNVPNSKLFHLFGIPESEAGKRVTLLDLPEAVTVGYRPHFPELEIRLETIGDDALLHEASEKVREELSDFIFSEEKVGSIPLSAHALLLQQRKTVSVAESCTGGYLGKLLTNEGGASAFFLGGALTYSNEMKTALLGVPTELLEKHGAVSPEVAVSMAAGAHQRFGSDLALSITGVAGPDGGSKEKPVGLFYVGLAAESFQTALRFKIPTNREYVRRYAAYAALDTVRRHLLGLPYLGKTSELEAKIPF